MQLDKLKNQLLPLKGSEKAKFLRDLKSYVYVYCEIDEDNRRIPIYVGKGKSDRFFSHLNNLDGTSNQKNKKIANLLKENRLSIDILAYNLTDKTALAIESACIDLMGIENLENPVFRLYRPQKWFLYHKRCCNTPSNSSERCFKFVKNRFLAIVPRALL